MPDTVSPIVSPLRGHNESRIHRHASDEPGVAFGERRLVSLVQVAAWPDTAAQVADILAARLGCTVAPGRDGSLDGPRGAVLAIAPGRWLLESPDPHLADQLADRIGPALGAVTDLSHARIAIRVSGPRTAWVLNKGLALDLHPAAFPPMKVAQSAVHEIGVTLRRLSPDMLGADGFDLYVPRGFALSFWHWLCEAAADCGYRVEPPGSV